MRLSRIDWLRYGPFLAQIIVTRRCNLSCGYCTEYDRSSAPIPFETLQGRLEKLRGLRTWAVSLMGGEPTLHPELLKIAAEMRRLGFKRRMMTTNGFKLTRELIEGLNESGLTDMSLSIDGVKRNRVTSKVLETLRRRLELLGRHARFDVVLSAVIGSAPREEVLEVVRFAESNGFAPRVLLLHDENGQLALPEEDRRLFVELSRRSGRGSREARDYRRQLLDRGEAPFKCRSGARYLYVDEHGLVRWCAQTRSVFGRSLADYGLEDLKEQFYTPKSCSARCSVGCVRTASAFDEWRSQRPTTTPTCSA